MQAIGFVGAGAMAEALIAGVLRAGLLKPEQLFASDVVPARLQFMGANYGIQTVATNEALLQVAEAVVLAVKPQVAREVLLPLGRSWPVDKLLISIVTGVTIADLEALLPAGVPVIRVVPNTPCLVGSGMSVLALGQAARAEHQQLATAILGAVGKTLVLPESLLDGVTALSGSGPAYVYLIIEALSDAGLRVGLPRDVATLLATQTVIGGGKMVQETGKHPAELKEKVTSPGGTTIAGLHVLEKGKVRAILIDAVFAAYERARELRGN